MPLPVLGGIAVGLLIGLIQLRIVATHPEPDPSQPDASFKPRYADLVRPPAAWLLLILVAVACIPIAWLAPALRPGWLVWASAGLILVAIDARSTWLPIRASVLTEVGLVLAIGAGALLTGDAWFAARSLIGASLAGGLFFLLWRVSGQLGFGDVRLAAMAGGLAAMGSTQWWFAALLGGSAASALWGLAVAAWRRNHPSPLGKAFAYGPGLWLGPWLGWAWVSLAPS